MGHRLKVLSLFTRDEKRLGSLIPGSVEILQIDDLDGESALHLRYPTNELFSEFLVEGNFLVQQDVDENWQMYEITLVDRVTNDVEEMKLVVCEHVYYELSTYPVVTRNFTSISSGLALNIILDGTRWQIGNVEVVGERSVLMEDVNPLEALRIAQGVWGGEFEFRVEIEDNEFEFFVDWVVSRGDFKGFRFEFGYNVGNILMRTDFRPLNTALVGRGEGVNIDDESGELLRIDFTNVEWRIADGDPANKPLGRNWVGDEDARVLYGKPIGNEYALEFSGIEGVDLGNPVAHQFSGSFSIEATVVLESIDNVTIFRKGINQAGTMFLACHGGNVFFGFFQAAGSFTQLQGPQLELGKVYNVGGSFKQDTGEIKIVVRDVDDDLVDSVSTNTVNTRPANIGNNSFIGKREIDDRFFVGIIDDVRLWDFGKTEQQFLDEWGREIGGTDLRLRGYYKFNEGSGILVEDSSPYTNHVSFDVTVVGLYEDFGGFDLGALDGQSGVTLPDANPQNWQVIQDFNLLGNKFVRLEETPFWDLMILDALPSGVDVDFLIRFRVNNVTSQEVVQYLRHDEGTFNGYYLLATGQNIQILKFFGGGFTALASESVEILVDTFYNMRFRVNGNNLFGKIWVKGTEEPVAWTLTATDSDIPGSGEIRTGGALADIDFEFVSIADGGDVAHNPDVVIDAPVWVEGLVPVRRHIFGVHESQADTLEGLLEGTWLVLSRRNEPRINIQANVADLERVSGFEHEKIRLGDEVFLIAKNFIPEIRAIARVIRIERNINNPMQTRIELGNFRQTSSEDLLAELESSRRRLEARSGIIERAEFFEFVGDPEFEYKLDIGERNIRIFGSTFFYLDGSGIFAINPLDLDHYWRFDNEGLRLTRDGGSTFVHDFGLDLVRIGTDAIFEGSLDGVDGNFDSLIAGTPGADRMELKSVGGQPFQEFYDSNNVLRVSQEESRIRYFTETGDDAGFLAGLQTDGVDFFILTSPVASLLTSGNVHFPDGNPSRFASVQTRRDLVVPEVLVGAVDTGAANIFNFIRVRDNIFIERNNVNGVHIRFSVTSNEPDITPTVGGWGFCGTNVLPWFRVHSLGFVQVPSDRRNKRDIVVSNLENELNAFKGLNFYHYGTEIRKDKGKQIGVMVEDCPDYILSEEKDGVDVYGLVSFVGAALKETINKVEKLEMEIELLKS